MKIVSLEDIKLKYGLNDKNSEHNKKDKVNDNQNSNDEEEHDFQVFDKAKTRVLKYVMYKKRTENEIRVKFAKDIDKDLLEDIIDELKSNGYISDTNYIERAVNEFMALKNMSLREIKYKLISKGVKINIIDDYFSEHNDELIEFERKSAQNTYLKKYRTMEKQDIITYLVKKGYKEESIKAIEED